MVINDLASSLDSQFEAEKATKEREDISPNSTAGLDDTAPDCSATSDVITHPEYVCHLLKLDRLKSTFLAKAKPVLVHGTTTSHTDQL